jgi:hypothetical protein
VSEHALPEDALYDFEGDRYRRELGSILRGLI